MPPLLVHAFCQFNTFVIARCCLDISKLKFVLSPIACCPDFVWHWTIWWETHSFLSTFFFLDKFDSCISYPWIQLVHYWEHGFKRKLGFSAVGMLLMCPTNLEFQVLDTWPKNSSVGPTYEVQITQTFPWVKISLKFVAVLFKFKLSNLILGQNFTQIGVWLTIRRIMR